MAKMNYSVAHPNASKLELEIPTTVQARGVVRIDKAGDKYADAIFKDNGYYKKLKNANSQIAKLCNKALNNKAIKTNVSSDVLKKAKKSALNREKWSEERRKDCKTKYETTLDMFNLMGMR